jgi:predicted nuclease of restriction endonuclease-like RecB superfamily
MMNLDNYSKEALWRLLVDTVHTSVMYAPHKAYVRDTVLHETPDITPDELARRLNMSLGSALVLLDEFANQQKTSP